MTEARPSARWAIMLGAVLSPFVTRQSLAADQAETEACLVASEQGQLARKETKYLHARAQFRSCAQGVCPQAVRRDCAQWLDELDNAQPSVILQARDAAGRDTSAVVVRLDGEPFVDRVDGRALDVDPGEHVFTFASKQGVVLEQRVIVRESEKGRTIVADFSTHRSVHVPSSTTSTRRSEERRIPAGSWALGAVGVVGIGIGSYLLISGRIRESELEAECQPRCPHDDVDAVRRRYWSGGIALGVGGLALGAAVVIALSP